jgi:hypothetical protein
VRWGRFRFFAMLAALAGFGLSYLSLTRGAPFGIALVLAVLPGGVVAGFRPRGSERTAVQGDLHE